MTELLAQGPLDPADDSQITAEAQTLIESAFTTTEAQLPTSALITEQEVLFSTAAAVPVRRNRGWTRALTAIRGAFITKAADSAPKRRHYPARLDYLEHSRMAREMHRL